MSFGVKYRGLDVTVDSLDQLDELADRIVNGTSSKSQNSVKDSPVILQPNHDHSSFQRILAGLNHNQRKLLLILADSGKQTDRDLREKLGLGDNNKALAGVLSGVSKAIKRGGLTVRLIDKESFRSAAGEREYSYSLRPSAKDEVKEVLNPKGRV